MLILAITVLFALSVSALCSLLEATVLSLTPGQVNDLSRTHPRAGEIWRGFKAQIQKPIAVILVLNTAAHTIGATIAGAKFEEQFGSAGLIWFSILFTYLMLQFTEILPKTMGVRYNRRLAPLMARPIALLMRLLSPVLWFIYLVNKPFERAAGAQPNVSTLEEITALAGMARIGGLLGIHQERIIHGAARLSRLTAADVMIPARDVVMMSTEQTLSQALDVAYADPHTRFPIHEGTDRNAVIGYINFKELVHWPRSNPGDNQLMNIIRPVYFVSTDTRAPDLLKAFVDRHEHIAIVRSASNETLGLVTLEDVIEELVGELEDEFDRLPRMVHRLAGERWMVGGGVPMRELVTQTRLDIPPANGNLSEWLIDRFGKTPRTGATHREGGWDFTVRRMRRGKIYEVAISANSQNA